MGNTLVGIAPSQIFPVEHYLTDQENLKFERSLGSTRFLKVAKAQSPEGPIVVKVFAIHDPSLPLGPHKERLDEIRTLLAPAVNCLPFQSVVVTDRAVLLMREYVKHSLYDRISTRPFLAPIEKRWITFQVLYALHQCHKVGVCHGDIKLENIALTSWNWVLLCDFASFKPTFLPEDNPADYSYFFDTSRRRTCYIAPERFVKAAPDGGSGGGGSMFQEAAYSCGELRPAMDIFSAGCALLELWTEGHAPFDLSQLLAYRSGERSLTRQLEMVPGRRLRALLESMLQRDPARRLSAELYLAQERGKLFPEYFYSFLQSYMLIFSSSPVLPPDEKVARLHKDISSVVELLTAPEVKAEGEEEEGEEVDDEIEESADGGLVLAAALATSCVRGLHQCTAKLQCLEVLVQLAEHAADETILDRLLPYVLHLAQSRTESSARVKAAGIHAVARCLALVRAPPPSDANVFPEYVLPGLAASASDPATCVRVALAHNLALLAETALRFLEHQVERAGGGEGGSRGGGQPGQRINYELELQTLHEMVQQAASALLTDPQTIVKQTLLESGVTRLCVFFGRQKANDVLLSHIITFLNDKEDKELRGSFFDCVVGVAAYVGWHSSAILCPLLQQGLSDSSEFVTAKCIRAMSALAQLGLLARPHLADLLADTARYLPHPSLWVRQAAAGFAAAAACQLSPLDVQCKLLPHLRPHLTHRLLQLDRAELVLDALAKPVPRPVFDGVVKHGELALLLRALEQRRDARRAASSSSPAPELPSQLRSLFRRLQSDGMTEHVEEQLLIMAPHLIKLHKHRTNADARHNKQSDGRIELTGVRSHVAQLGGGVRSMRRLQPPLIPSNNTSTIAPSAAVNIQPSSTATTVPGSGGGDNSEWQHMFGAEPTTAVNVPVAMPVASTGDGSSPAPELEVPTGSGGGSSLEQSTVNVSLHERSYIQYQVAECRVALRTLISRQQEQYLEAVRSRECCEQRAWQAPLPPPSWRPRGQLVAHLHEHRAAVTRLAPLPNHPLFASASLDGCVRLWDCAKMEGRNIANRSRQVYRSGSAVSSLAACGGGGALAAATADGQLVVLRCDVPSSRMFPLSALTLDAGEDGPAIEVQWLEGGGLLAYGTLYGGVCGWDPRTPAPAWRLQADLKQGVVTSLCADAQGAWLAVGTSSGYHVAWDLRFQLPITTIVHPSGARVRRLAPHPADHAALISAVHGNNEVSIWNLETGFRQCVLWASAAPALSSTQVSAHAVCALAPGLADRAPFLLAAGTDQRLRFWDLDTPSASSIVPEPTPNTRYETRLVDGTSVVIERTVPSPAAPATAAARVDETPRAGPEPPPQGHRDWISDVALCKASQCLVLTASKDGVIKVWK